MEKNVFDAYTIKNQSKIITVPANVKILAEGEVNLDMYKVVSGHVEMYTGYGTKYEVLIGILGPGMCFGEFGILLHKPAIYTIITFDEVRLLRVTEGALGNFVQENQDYIIHIMRNMANMMMAMTHNVVQLSSEVEKINDKEELNEAVKKSPDIKKEETKRAVKKQDEMISQEKLRDEIKKVLREYTRGYRYDFFGRYLE
ncbi:cyclic nucleotide-binding domain-containing protein [Butyrivibrio sp. NC3005]|uniref:cyclic nucleotide-binding domain-containing protein n=1 Tax=Butyrivibrio sp. NC3005 TaxID=1280685 RepID=UPI0004081837|nr:cyclic nucleotide-binding domain-containing protein [Butyrivibrio sp. NC3005]